MFERSESVLWTDALPGIVLHNLETHRYLELGELGYHAWALLDGARVADEVVTRLAAGGPADRRPAIEAQAWEIVAMLATHGFVVERSHD